jgi:hypothetical protein
VTGFALRAPWYVRERGHFGLRDPRALRPSIQMYDGTDFVTRLLADPRDSLATGADDWWSYPVPVTPPTTAHGRARLATWALITSPLRKLYQPSHSRFYAVVVEVFCDEAGLPRAGPHRDIEVRFVMRRWRTSVTGAPRPTRRLTRNLLVHLAAQQEVGFTGAALPEDARDLWWADRVAFEENNRDLIDQMVVDSAHEGWFTSAPAGWKRLDEASPDDDEQEFPMWRLPRRKEDCDAAATRSTWFGIIPTHSGEHFVRGDQVHAKLDDRAIYQVRCFVRQKPAPGHEHCPPKIFWGMASQSFRLASPMDPQGTAKRTTTITQPDLRQLAARAGQKQGPGGVRVATPPQSQLVINPFNGIPDPGEGAVGAGGGTCTFALELLFIVAFFLFQLFLPIVIFAFQLWWMLALRFCFPPSSSFTALSDFFAAGHTLSDLETNPANDKTSDAEFDRQFGLDSPSLPAAQRKPGWAQQLGPFFQDDPNFVNALVVGTDPTAAALPGPPDPDSKPPDPLCP